MTKKLYSFWVPFGEMWETSTQVNILEHPHGLSKYAVSYLAKEVSNKRKGTYMYKRMNWKKGNVKECTCTFTNSDVRILSSERYQV